MEKVIELRHIYKTFNGHQVLDDLNLTIPKGESLVIIGRSGCGKSVLLKHMMGIMRPDAGSVLVGDIDITTVSTKELDSIRMKFGMLFQGAALFDSLTVFENVGFQLLEYTTMPMDKVRKRVAECLHMVGMRGIEHMKPAELSGGMKKRVGLARAICMSPEIILFDEPTTGVDPIMGDIINELIRSLHDRLGVTSVTVTHDMKSAYKIADRICMLYDKKLMEIGTPLAVQNSDNEKVRQFVTGAAKGPLTEEGEE